MNGLLSVLARRYAIPVTLAAVSLTAALVMASVSVWWLNADGAGYLYLAHSLVTGHGYAFPDGSLATFRGPIYPLLLGIASVFSNDPFGAVVVDRLSFVASSVLVCLLVRNLTGRWAVGLFAGMLATVQPLPIVSGAQNLVPDGPAVAFALGAVVAATWPAPRMRWLYVGVLVVLSALTKETSAAIVLPLAALFLPQRWKWISALLLATLILPFAAIVVLNGEPWLALRGVGSAVVGALSNQVYIQTPWLWAVPAVAFAVMWSVWNLRLREFHIPLLIVALGLSLLAYASLANLGARNGLIGAYGVSALVAVAAADVSRSRVIAVRLGVVTVVAAFVVTSVLAIRALAVRPLIAESWDNVAVSQTAAWLQEHASGRAVATTFFFSTRLATLTEGSIDLSLVPMYSASLRARALADLDFDERKWWLAFKKESPPPGDRLISLKSSNQFFGGVFEQALLKDLTDNNAEFLVVSGNSTSLPHGATFDAGLIVPYLESSPYFTREFASSPEQLPIWLAVYRVNQPLSAIEYPTTIESTVAHRIGTGEFMTMNPRQYRELLDLILEPWATR